MSTNMLRKLWGGGHALVCLLAVASIGMRGLYTYALLASAVTYLLPLFANHSRPRGFTAEAWGPILSDPNTLNVMFALLCISHSPNLVVLFPVVAKSLFHLCAFLLSLDPVKFGICNKVVQYPDLKEAVAFAEIMVIIVLILSVFTGNLMNAVNAFVYSSYLRMRYFSDQLMRSQFTMTRMMFDKVFHHSMCPAAVTGVYVKAVAYISSLGTPPVAPNAAR